MSYPAELLSHRQRGKLAPCWLAAMSSEKVFKRYYNSGAIKKMNVVETCKDILQKIQCNRSDRFSLYQSSQLMCGITRIHSYQIKCFEKEAFEIQQKLDFTTLLQKGDEFDAIEDFEFPTIELPLSSKNFLNTQLETNLHILPGEDLNDKLQIAMQDATCLNFGCLNDEELNFMLELDNDLTKRLQINEEKDISDKLADISITEETQERQLSGEILSPVLVNVSKRNKSKERLSLTPQKRQPHQMQVETPTKRRRLSFETAAMTVPSVPVEDVTVPVLELPIEETRMLVLSQRMETDMELESLHSSYFMIDRHPKKGKLDQKIVLNDKQLGKWRQNVNIHCRQLDRPLTHHLSLTPAINLFKQPSHSPKRWNNTLRDRFVNRITGPFTRVDEDVALTEPVQFPETIRVQETISKLNLPTEDLSTFGKTDTAIPVEHVDSIVNILQMTNIIHETVEKTVSMVPLPVLDTVTLEEGTSIVEHKLDQERANISNTDESFEDIEILLDRKRRSSKTKHMAVSSTIPSKLSQPSLTSQEIFALLEVLWCDKEAVKFDELIPEDTYTREDAATAFEILLEFHAQKKVILQQIDCSHALRILKYKD